MGKVGAAAVTYPVRTASGLILWAMRTFGVYGWTSLWRTIYIRPGHESRPELIRHEQRHAHQMETLGRVAFAVKYSWATLRHGYTNNMFEVDARAAETQGKL